MLGSVLVVEAELLVAMRDHGGVGAPKRLGAVGRIGAEKSDGCEPAGRPSGAPSGTLRLAGGRPSDSVTAGGAVSAPKL